MASFLFAWELGGGAGHCINLLPVIEALLSRGRRVSLAARDLHTARRVFGQLNVDYLQAPLLREPPINPVTRPQNFAHILHNVGFGDSQQLEPLISAWRMLIELTAPDVIVFEHSPAALLASRFFDVGRVVIGTGFFSPPDQTPLPSFLPRVAGPPTEEPESEQIEQALLDRTNQLLQSGGRLPINRVSQLYSEADENFLLTFPELDHYPSRPGARYWGMWSPSAGVAPNWRDGTDIRLFAYLQPPQYSWQPAHVLAVLRKLNIESVVFVPGVARSLLSPYEAPHIHFESRRLDMNEVCDKCHVAITHGNNGTATQLLRRGVPQLLVPLFVEQVVFSHRLVSLGAALAVSPNQPDQIESRLISLMRNERHQIAATEFARRHAGFDPKASSDEIVNRIERLASRRNAS